MYSAFTLIEVHFTIFCFTLIQGRPTPTVASNWDGIGSMSFWQCSSTCTHTPQYFRVPFVVNGTCTAVPWSFSGFNIPWYAYNGITSGIYPILPFVSISCNSYYGSGNVTQCSDSLCTQDCFTVNFYSYSCVQQGIYSFSAICGSNSLITNSVMILSWFLIFTCCL